MAGSAIGAVETEPIARKGAAGCCAPGGDRKGGVPDGEGAAAVRLLTAAGDLL